MNTYEFSVKVLRVWEYVKRKLEGDFWYPVFGRKDWIRRHGLRLSAEKGAVKRGTPGWRDSWRWAVLQVDCGDETSWHGLNDRICITKLGVKIRFLTDGGKQMRHFALIFKKYILVRVGDEDVVFSAQLACGGRFVPLKLVCGPASRERIFNVLRGIDPGVMPEDLAWI